MRKPIQPVAASAQTARWHGSVSVEKVVLLAVVSLALILVLVTFRNQAFQWFTDYAGTDVRPVK